MHRLHCFANYRIKVSKVDIDPLYFSSVWHLVMAGHEEDLVWIRRQGKGEEIEGRREGHFQIYAKSASYLSLMPYIALPIPLFFPTGLSPAAAGASPQPIKPKVVAGRELHERWSKAPSTKVRKSVHAA